MAPDSRQIRLQNIMMYLTKIHCFNFSVAILFSFLKLESLSVNLRSLFIMSAAFSSLAPFLRDKNIMLILRREICCEVDAGLKSKKAYIEAGLLFKFILQLVTSFVAICRFFGLQRTYKEQMTSLMLACSFKKYIYIVCQRGWGMIPNNPIEINGLSATWLPLHLLPCTFCTCIATRQ